jgi:MoaA/NifB/PqqE/SkfB family radical SAM enzyme
MVMGSDRATLGSVRESSFVEVWRGDRYRRFREQLVDGPPPAVCAGCSAYRGVF